MSTHEEVLARLPGYPELSGYERLEVDRHAEACPDCAAALEHYRQLRAAVAHIPRLAPDPGALDAVHAAIRRKASGHEARGGRDSRLPAFAWLAVAVVVLLAGGGLWLKDRIERNTAAPAISLPLTPAPLATATATPAPTPDGTTGSSDAREFASALVLLKANAIPFAGVEPGGGTGDLAALRDMVGDARIVVIDDSTYYGTHELQAMQQRLLEYLVQELGFTRLLVDAPEAQVATVDHAVRFGELNPDEVLPGLTGTPWQTTEMLYTLRWLAAHNQRVPTLQQVSVQGLVPTPGGDSAATDPNERRQLAILSTSLNVVKIIDQGRWDSKYVVWMHGNAGNAAVDTDGIVSLLRGRYTNQVVRIGFAFGQAQLYTVSGNLSLSLTPIDYTSRTLHQIPPPPVHGSYEDFFAQSGLPRFMVDMRKLSHTFVETQSGLRPTPANGWLRKEHPYRMLSATYNDCYPEDYFAPVELQSQYDVVIYFDRVSPASPLVKVAEAQPVVCQAAPENLDFSRGADGWSMLPATTGYQMGVQRGTGYLQWAGEPGSSGASSSPPKGSAALQQMFRADDYRGRRVRLSATLQLDAPSALSTFSLAIFRPRYEVFRSTEVQVESVVSQRYELVLDVPEDATRIMFGVNLSTAGRVSISDVRFEVVGKDVPLGAHGPRSVQ